MISWIQRSFQHHFKIVFAVILAVTVLSFVFTIGSTPGIGRADHREVNQDFFGHNLASPEEKERVGEDARLSALLRFGGNMSAEQLQFFAFQRVAALHLADQMKIPATSPVELQEFIQTLRMFQGQDGRFDASRYDAFRSSLKPGSGISQAMIARVIAEDVRISKIEMYLGGPGYILPSGVQEVLMKGDTSWTLQTATIDYASFETGSKPTETQIAKFFTDNSFRYTIPPRVSADYLSFPAEAYAPKVSVTDAEVRDYYFANPARFPNPAAKPAGAKADPAADFAAVQPKVRAALVLEKARREAVKAASDLAYSLYEGKVAKGAGFDAFVQAHGLKVASLAPFTLEAGPAELGGSREVANAAFELNASRFYSEGIPTADGAVILIWKETIPSHDPLLAEVREKVVADAVDNEKRKSFIEFGQTLRASIQAKLKAGEAFDKAAAEAAGSVKVEVKSYPAFALSTRTQTIDPVVFEALDGLEKGGVSAMQAGADKGVIVYAADKKPPVVGPANPRFMQVWARLAMAFSRTDSEGILSEVVDREVKRMDAALK